MTNYPTFTTKHEDTPGLLPDKMATICDLCGWKTTARDVTLYGPPNALQLELLDHRLSHLEGRYPAHTVMKDA